MIDVSPVHDSRSSVHDSRSSSEAPQSAPAVDWRQAHQTLSQLAKTRARLDWDEVFSMLRALRTGAHIHLGFASFAEYIERLFGYKPRWTEERARVAEALETLPELTQALHDGTIAWSIARELTRVATRDNETDWLRIARGRSARQVEELVAGHRPGDRPEDPSSAALRRYVLRFEVSAEPMATFRD